MVLRQERDSLVVSVTSRLPEVSPSGAFTLTALAPQLTTSAS